MNVHGLKSTLGAVVVYVIATSCSNFAYSSALNSNLIYDDGWRNTPVKYIPTYNELSLEDKQFVQQFEQSERIQADSIHKTEKTIEDKIVYKLMTEYNKDSVEAHWWSREIMKASHTYNEVSPREIMTLIAVESTFNKTPKGRNNVGPMQVNRGVWIGKTKYNLFKPDDNIQLGTMIFNDYKTQCRGNLECSFKTYNVGPGDYKARRKLAKQKSYYESVTKAYRQFKDIV